MAQNWQLAIDCADSVSLSALSAATLGSMLQLPQEGHETRTEFLDSDSPPAPEHNSARSRWIVIQDPKGKEFCIT